LGYEQLFWQRPLDRLGRSVWRYMPYWKFDDLVTRRSLFFTRLRYIVDQEIDIFEGALGQANFERPQVNADWMLHNVLAPGQPTEIVDVMNRYYGDREWIRDMQESDRDNTYINCWFTGEYEDERMWNEYVPDGDGIVVQSTVRMLMASLQDTPGSIQMDSVVYYNRTPDAMVPPDPYRTPLYKHIFYQHEHEFRCFVVVPQIHGEYVEHPDKIGYWVPCALSQLIQRVRTSPSAPHDLLHHVQELCEGSGLSHVHCERSVLKV
jgi:hypothetical protein